MLEQALQLRSLGFAIHWLHSKSKRPIGDNWSEKPVLDAKGLRASYKNGNNVGVRLGQWSKVGGLYMHIIDMDIRKPEMLSVARDKLAEVLPEFDIDSAVTVISGSGGESRHFYVLTEQPFPGRVIAHSEGVEQVPEKRWNKKTRQMEDRLVDKHDWEIQLLGTGSQAVVPPSIHDKTGKPYVWLRPFDESGLDLGIVDSLPAAALARAMEYDIERSNELLGTQEPMGITPDEIAEILAETPNENLPYDEWINVVGAVQFEAADKTGAEKAAYLKVLQEWSATGTKHDPDYTEDKFKNGFKNSGNRLLITMRTYAAIARDAQLDRAIDDIEDDFEDLGDEPVAGMFDDLLGGEADAPSPKKARKKKLKWQSEDAPEWIQKMNRKHAVIIVGGKASVMRFDPKSPSDEDHELWDMKTFHDWYLAKPTVPITVGKGKDGKPKIEFLTLSKAFMSNEFRRGYEDGYIFDTTSENTAGFNLFRGWGVEPKKGSCDRILWHIKHVICAEDDTANEYFLDYLAHMFQKPWEIPRAAIVVKGEEGAGKDTIAKYMHKLVGRYIPKITGQDQFFGNFNGFLKNALFVNIQEAFVGSQQQNEKLKQFVTEDMLRVENKYQNSHDTPNYMRIYITSNNFKVVQASESSRRFLVLNARDTYASTGVPAQEKMRQEYFDAIYDEMNGNGPAALLHFLLNRKLANFPRTPPVTDELSTQVASGWKGMRKFIYQAALYGTFDLQNGEDNTMFKRQWAKGDVVVDKGDFRQRFIEWSRGRSARDMDEVELTPTAVTKLLDSMCGVQASRRRLGDQGERKHCYVFPRLALVRERIGKAARGKLEWGDEREVEEMAHEDEEDDL